MNRIIPFICVIGTLYFLVASAKLKSRKLVADEKGVTLAGGEEIAYASIKQTDKRYFEKEGHFTIEYGAGGTDKKVKLSDRDYDGLGLLLDEVVRRTGAAPAESGQEGKE